MITIITHKLWKNSNRIRRRGSKKQGQNSNHFDISFYYFKLNKDYKRQKSRYYQGEKFFKEAVFNALYYVILDSVWKLKLGLLILLQYFGTIWNFNPFFVIQNITNYHVNLILVDGKLNSIIKFIFICLKFEWNCSVSWIH